MGSNISEGKVLVFHDSAYPHISTPTAFTQLLPCEFQIADASDLSTKLEAGCRLLVSFHGPYFPKQAWTAIHRFLEQGGSIAIFGGMPFSRPVREDGYVEPEQDAYSKQLYLGPFFQIEYDTAHSYQFVPARAASFLNDSPLQVSSPGTFWSCYPKLSQVSDRLAERGSGGPIDTVLTPLLYLRAKNEENAAIAVDECNGAFSNTGGVSNDNVATPVFLLEQRRGHFRGGCWLISAWQPATEQDWLDNAESIRCLISLMLAGIQAIDVRPVLACYQPGETPSLIVAGSVQQPCAAQITVSDMRGQEIASSTLVLAAPSSHYEEHIMLPRLSEAGLYRVKMQYQALHGQKMTQESGFWLWDASLVEHVRDKRLTTSRNHFYQGDQVFPIVGTTYMDSQVQRKFLLLPNPARWDHDFAEMKAAGMNLIRTGIWTGWDEMMPVAGVMSEAALRALDAFVMTACKYNIQVIFNFFAFYPPLFDGEDPWHDPRSLQAQEDFVAIIARRYAQVELVSWDLINEPSLGDPANAFAKRPLPHYHRLELAAFQGWLAQRYTLSELQLRWHQTPLDFSDWSQITLPEMKDYQTVPSANDSHNKLKVADYTHFTQEAFKRWAERMYRVIREAGSQTLVGVGQDEAGARIAPQFYAPVVDYTTTHPWWNNDDLLWDMLLDKTLTVPNLIQETGVMLVRDVDGRPWRSEMENAHLLERKLITGLIARGAGLIQWLWHTNSYMISDNENSIGLVRADGSAKPELAVMREFAQLMQEVAQQRVDTMQDVWVVIPYSQWFARPELAVEGTRQAVRVLGYDFGIVPQLIGEYQLGELVTTKERPQTVIVPALQLFDVQAWQHLRQYVAEGGTLLVSGILGRDSHNLPFEVGIEGLLEARDTPTPVTRYETLEDGPVVAFGHEKMGYVKKAHNQLRVRTYGKGTLLWSGLPLELADTSEATHEVYGRVLKCTQEGQCKNSPLLVVRRPMKDGYLILIVSETSSSQEIVLDEGIHVCIAPNRAGALIIQEGRELRALGGLTLPSTHRQ